MGGKPFFGWFIALSAMTVLFVTNGMIIGGINVFDEALLEEFGWSRAALKFRDLLTFAIAGLLGPFAGAIADRFGVRRPMAVGATILLVCFLMYGRIQSSLHMYIVHVFLAVVLASCGLIVCVMLVSRWFKVHRGTAIGITLVGTSLGGMLLPPLGTFLIQRLGWRHAMMCEAVLPLLLLVVIAVVIRNAPEDKGLRPLGEGAPEPDTEGAPPGFSGLTGLSYGEALRTGTFWALAFTAMATFYSILGAQAHLFLHLRDLEFTPQVASAGLSVLFGLALVGKFGFGYLADMLPHKAVFLGNLAVMLVGSVLLATMDVGLFWVAIVLFGLGWGGLYTLLQLLTVESLGLKAAGKILGTITVLDAIGGGLGIWLTGLLYDRTGSYQLPFVILVVLISLALVAATQVRRHVPVSA